MMVLGWVCKNTTIVVGGVDGDVGAGGGDIDGGGGRACRVCGGRGWAVVKWAATELLMGWVFKGCCSGGECCGGW